MRRPNRRPDKALARYERAVARQQRLIQRGYYLRLHDTEPRFVAATPAPITEFTRQS